MTRGRVKAKRATPRRRESPQEGPEWWSTANMLLALRSGERCEHCGVLLNGRAERHHRQRRQVGGDRLSNLLLLLPEHHTWITEHPAEALEAGWIVSTYGPDGTPDPATVPVRIAGQFLWLLDDHGGKERLF